MYDMLYDHLIAIIYAGELQRLRLDTIHSVKSTADPTAFGVRINSALPLRFESGH